MLRLITPVSLGYQPLSTPLRTTGTGEREPHSGAATYCAPHPPHIAGSRTPHVLERLDARRWPVASGSSFVGRIYLEVGVDSRVYFEEHPITHLLLDPERWKVVAGRTF